jgi:hypothetical protein
MQESELTAAAEAVESYLCNFRANLEQLEIRPRFNNYRDRVLLALLSKAYRNSEGVICLVHRELYSEAFGLNRTCLEVFLNIRYLVDKDTEARCKRYVEYFGKERELATKALLKHGSISPAFEFSEDHEDLLKLAKQYNTPYNWRPDGETLKDIAYEPSTWATNSDGTPQVWEYAYDVVYRLMSHQAHATCIAVGPDFARFSPKYNFTPAFDFSFKGVISDGFDALFGAWLFLHAALLEVFHFFGLDLPTDVQESHQKLRQEFGVSDLSSTTGMREPDEP